jgi:hypothetical protein
VASGRPFELYFKSGDMNDVLKSLTMIDISGRPGISSHLTWCGDRSSLANLIGLIQHDCTLADTKKAKKDVGADEPVVGGGTSTYHHHTTRDATAHRDEIAQCADIAAWRGVCVDLVSSISYESTRPFDKQLDDLSLSLNEHSTMRDLLGQVKGTPVRVEVLRHGKREFVEGTVIGAFFGVHAHSHAHALSSLTWLSLLRRTNAGLERKQVQSPRFHEAHFLALLVGGKSVQYYNLNAVIRLRFANELMRQDLRHLLAVLLQAKKKDMKSVTGYTRGDGEASTIRASYIVEAPVWKATYRLFFNNQRRASTEADAELPQSTQSIIEGWALVDNTQNEDWRGVELSLVSGASNSFIYDLYKPRYAARTEVLISIRARWT